MENNRPSDRNPKWTLLFQKSKQFLFTVFLGVLFFPSHGQISSFEGILEYTVINKEDALKKRKIIEDLKGAGWSEMADLMAKIDSTCSIYYIKGDSIWGEMRINNSSQVFQYYYQVGLNAQIISPQTGHSTQLGKTKDFEQFMDNHTTENWREKIDVNELYKTDFSRYKKVKNKTKIIHGYDCSLYRYVSPQNSEESSYYWIANDLVVTENQVLPYFFGSVITPFGVIMGSGFTLAEMSGDAVLKNIVHDSIDPILPKFNNLKLKIFDGVAFEDTTINHFLKGKTIEPFVKAPDFAFYSLDHKAVVDLYSRQNSGKFILFDLWATWCGPCVKEFPQIRQLHSENSTILEIIGLNVGDHRENSMREFIHKYNLVWPQAYAGELLRSFLNPTKSIPFAILLDDQMKVRWMGNPTQHWGEIESIIRNP